MIIAKREIYWKMHKKLHLLANIYNLGEYSIKIINLLVRISLITLFLTKSPLRFS